MHIIHVIYNLHVTIHVMYNPVTATAHLTATTQLISRNLAHGLCRVFDGVIWKPRALIKVLTKD